MYLLTSQVNIYRIPNHNELVQHPLSLDHETFLYMYEMNVKNLDAEG